MKKSVVFGLSVAVAVAVQAGNYVADIEVDSTKSNGKSWDIAGGAPDIRLRIEGKFLPMREACRDSYRCTTSAFVTQKERVYIEVYDQDAWANDLVGKGECTIGNVCKVGAAKIAFKKVDNKAIVVSDARYDLRIRIAEVAERLSEKIRLSHTIDSEEMQSLIEDMKRLYAYGESLSKRTRKKIEKLIRMLEGLGKTGDGYREMLKRTVDTEPTKIG